MKNNIQNLPSEFSEHLSNLKVKTALFSSAEGRFYLYLSGEWSEHREKRDQYPNAKIISGMLGSSGSSWSEKAYAFCVSDCFDPCVYVQFGSSWEDAYESFCDNEPSLRIDEHDLGDYGATRNEDGTWNCDALTCSFTSDGQAIDTDNTHSVSSQELKLVEITF